MTTEHALDPNLNPNPGTAPEPAAPRPLSRQRLWQLKMRSEHRCWRCGEPAIRSLCTAHLIQERERQRRINGYSARHFNALSYVLGGQSDSCLNNP
jgi:hypothetical protein